MKNSRVILSLLIILVLSCTGIVYDVASSPEGSELRFEFDFSSTSTKPDSLPENTTVLMSELVGDKHYLFDTTTGFSIIKDNEFPVNNGDYFIVSLSSEKDDFNLVGIKSFLDTLNPTGVSALQMNLKTLTREQVTKKYCPGLSTVAYSYETVPPVSPFYLSIDNRVPVYFREVGEKITLTLKPVEVSAALNFSVNIEFEDGVVADSVFAAISGVPCKLMLMDGVAVKDTLGKTFFKMLPESGEYGSGKWVGTVNTWGLFSADFGDYITGPGIFWVAVTASYEGKSRVIGAGLNIKEMIDAKEIMKSDDEGQTWSLAVDKVSFNIDKNLYISKEMILSGGTDAVEGWIPVEDEKNPIVVEF